MCCRKLSESSRINNQKAPYGPSAYHRFGSGVRGGAVLDRRVRRRAFLKYAAAGTGVLLAPALFGARPTSVASAPETLDALLEPVRAAHDVPALAGAFVRGQELIGLGAIGVRRVGASDPVQPTDRFHLGSCTKSMTATLLAILVEQGKITWDATLGDLFPALRNQIHAGYRSVTLVQLLSHRSGLPEGIGRDSPVLQPAITVLTGGSPLPRQRLTLLELVLSQPPAVAPGSRFLYSNLGYMFAGAVAEQMTGQAWEDLMRQLVFAPLGMSTVGFRAPGFAQPWGHRSPGCQPVEPTPQNDDIAAFGPAGLVHASLSDWARYGSLHLMGSQGAADLLLKPQSFQQLHKDHYQQEYALGWAVLQRTWAGGTALHHGGTNLLWYAVIWLGPARNIGFLAATNCGGERAAQACDAAVTAIARKYLA